MFIDLNVNYEVLVCVTERLRTYGIVFTYTHIDVYAKFIENPSID